MIRTAILTCLFLTSLGARAQTLLTLDANRPHPRPEPGNFHMGSPGPAGRELVPNTRYLTLGGEPILPVMGEMHFSRVPREHWRDVLLKMKAGGITIVSCYLFWNHHEEREGQFDWSGDKDFRGFVQLCASLGLWVYPRIGPWSHGEARNGGTPDWILRKQLLVDRSNDPVYQHYVTRYFHEIGLQMQGLLYKDGGPIVGIQLENEYARGKGGEAHILWLKHTARACGMDVPLYTVTGWGDGSVPPGEVIPLWGGYPDEPWDDNTEPLTGCSNYRFDPFRDDDKIGNGLAQRKDRYMDYSGDPYFTCEMGAGVQNTGHRRLVIGALDGLGMIMGRIGSGANLLGYYLFAGGSDPVGLLHSNQEEKDETGYWSETPAISYDFQAPIGESGRLAPSYYEVKKINYFLRDFGPLLAPMDPVFGPVREGRIQYAARTDGTSGFLFGLNYCRHGRLPAETARFDVRLAGETIHWPAVDIPDSSIFIWPFNLSLGEVRLRYATAQPLGRLGDSTWVFVETRGVPAEFCLDTAGAGGEYLIHPGPGVFRIPTHSGHTIRIVLLTAGEGLHAWLLGSGERRRLYLSNANMYLDGDGLHVFGPSSDLSYASLEDTWVRHVLRQPSSEVPLVYHRVGILDDALWLKSGVKTVNPGNLLYHTLFWKEFSLDDPPRIRSARLFIRPATPCRVKVNDTWVNQPLTPGALNTIDLTGYVRKGDNVLLLDFPFRQGDSAFAARVQVDYTNTDQVNFYTDSSWLTSAQYNFPSPLARGNQSGFGPPTALPLQTPQVYAPGFSEWTLDMPCGGLNTLYLGLDYNGNKARLRLGDRLIADNFNNNTPWYVNLDRASGDLECRTLRLELYPLEPDEHALFDRPPGPGEAGKTGIRSIWLEPVYEATVAQ